jgi:hypothetical protein
MFFVVFFVVVFYITPTQYTGRSYGDFPAILVEEDLRCPSIYYFRHEQTLE